MECKGIPDAKKAQLIEESRPDLESYRFEKALTNPGQAALAVRSRSNQDLKSMDNRIVQPLTDSPLLRGLSLKACPSMGNMRQLDS
ncbi:hypothetical protein FVE85_5898 [Porphyridium purpureum]|uniref:Uncharacterized protein n=1 Tax=Porphyridium purpureum TaxID=35688 RepID=A0A5J4Z649_PORPP|nr:hypothetical protein FVE85_5898 [Porphyridium purpureum]|eukprot:POR3848..scf295_1